MDTSSQGPFVPCAVEGPARGLGLRGRLSQQTASVSRRSKPFPRADSRIRGSEMDRLGSGEEAGRGEGSRGHLEKELVQ